MTHHFMWRGQDKNGQVGQEIGLYLWRQGEIQSIKNVTWGSEAWLTFYISERITVHSLNKKSPQKEKFTMCEAWCDASKTWNISISLENRRKWSRSPNLSWSTAHNPS